MSFIARRALRAAPRRVRFNSSSAINDAPATVIEPTAEWRAQQDALTHHAGDATELWRKISIYVCIPAIVAGGLWVYQTEQHHKEHLDHLRAENDGKLPEIPNYDHLNRRVKPFPWGMNSLFFNPAVNKDLEAEAE